MGAWWTVFGLWGLAVAQPLLDLLGRTTAFFLSHQADRTDLVLFALAVSLAGPALLIVIVFLFRRLGKWGRWAEATVCGLLAALVAAHWMSRWTAPAWLVVILALSAGALAGGALRRWRAVRTATTWLGAAAWIFPLIFLLVSPARKIGAGPDAPSTADKRVATTLPERAAVLVVFDEFPLVTLLDGSEAIDSERYPNFAALAATATWYRNATTAAQSTPFAIPTILSGRYPRAAKGIQPVWVDYKTNLFTAIGRRANLHVAETMSQLCPKHLCSGQAHLLPRRFRLETLLEDAVAVYLHLVTPGAWAHRLPVIGESWRDFWRPPIDPETSGRNPHKQDVQEVLDRFVEDLSQFPPPALHYLHLMAPHLPWTRLPDGTTYRVRQRTPHGLTSQSWRGSEWETVQAHQRHLLHVGWVDSLLGRLRASLEDLGLWRDAIVVVTSDHGASFLTEGRRRNLSSANFAEIVNIPLFIKYPSQETGVIDDSNAETVDIMPTMLAAMEAPIPRKLRGHDLAGAKRRETKTVYLSGLRATGPGHAQVYGLERVLERRQALALKLERFGAGSWDTVYAAGPFDELLGRPLDALRGADRPATEPQVRLDHEEDLADVDLRRERLPVHLLGQLIGLDDESAPEPLTLAVAVNGIVRATTETFLEEDAWRFTVMIPKAALAKGRNRIEIVRVDNRPDGPSIQRLVRAAASRLKGAG